MSRKEREHNI